ncbi:MAG: hypothetical protein Ta2A_16660 [Treponemataceae bacterium]|nr:MAG: hypothetical protein Ta2A_16660 [Treponemataceae bacterium]
MVGIVGTNGTEKFATNIVVLTESENDLVETLLLKLSQISESTLDSVVARITNMETLAACIAGFPSLLERSMILGENRSQYTLIELLLSQREGDKVLYLPSKATLGKSFLIAKFHTFNSLRQIARDIELDTDVINAFDRATSIVLFTLMAEDVYLNMLDDVTIKEESRRQIAMALIILWEYRNDSLLQEVAPVLQAVWDARKNLAPVFGSMMGSSELMLLSFDLNDSWSHFITVRISDPDVSSSLEEFLFGLSYEQISNLRAILRNNGRFNIDRSEISEFLGTTIKTDLHTDLRDFYMQYSTRRDNARVRARLNYPGPHHTLEDHYMSYVLANSPLNKYDEFFK